MSARARGVAITDLHRHDHDKAARLWTLLRRIEERIDRQERTAKQATRQETEKRAA